MAANLDKSENALTTVSTLTYLRGIDASGNSVKISTSDLASIIMANESQLENKTAIATNDYVRMVDEDGDPVKIKKDSFMAAIRDALPSIISDGETGGGSVLSIINGALKSRTDANLASVLCVREIGCIRNMATAFDTPTLNNSSFLVQSYDQTATHNLSGKYCGLLLTFKINSGLTADVKTPSLIQININLSSDSANVNLTSLVNASKIRYKNGIDGTWSGWV